MPSHPKFPGRPQLWYPGYDRDHPLSKGLVFAVDLAEGTGTTVRDVVKGRIGILRAEGAGVTPKWVGSSHGGALRNTTNNGFVEFESASDIVPTDGFLTVVLLYRKTDITSRSSSAFGVNAVGGVGSFDSHLPFSTGVVFFTYQTGGSRPTYNWEGDTGVDTDWHVWIFTVGSRGNEIWQDGILRAQTTPNRAYNVSDQAFRLGRSNQVSDLKEMGCFLLYDRQMSFPEIAALSADPFSPFRPPMAAKFSPMFALQAGGLFRRSNLDGLGGGGPFFNDPLAG